MKLKTKTGTQEFFWKDKTGRGFTQVFNQSEVKRSFQGERSWHGEAASTWARRSTVGDKWENAANEITRTK